MLDTLQEINGAIKRNKMRTIATGFAVASGLFLIIVLQGAGNGVINSFESNMGNFAFDAIHIFGCRTTKPHEGIKEGRFIQLDNRDVEMTEHSFSHYVKDVMPSLNQSGLIVSHGTQHQSATLMGVKPGWDKMNAVKIMHGRFINEIDLRQKRKSVVMSDVNAQTLFPHVKNVVGKTLDFNGISYTVVGVFKLTQEAEVTIGDGINYNQYLPTYAYYNYSLTQQIYTASEIGQAGSITAIAFKVSNSKSTARTVDVYLKHVDKTTFANSDWETFTSDDRYFRLAIAWF